ncbi:hypothetical protein [Paenibacillus sp. NPDC058071]|uniref:hypothetical protein n=1 Tax=Paenibacillus sp. NPDC058071 TaxID=3346326 RepID=UPI0036DB2488
MKSKEPVSRRRTLKPEMTQKWMIIGGLLFLSSLVILIYLRDEGVITDKQGINIGWVFAGISALTLLLDTLARDKATMFYRFIGVALLALFAYIRYF